MDKEKLKKDFAKVIDEFHGHPDFIAITLKNLALHSKKNKQYATDVDPLSNFRRGAYLNEKLINPPEGTFTPEERAIAYALILASKQVDGVGEILAERKKNTPDSLREKEGDVSVYYMIAEILTNVLETKRMEEDNEAIANPGLVVDKLIPPEWERIYNKKNLFDTNV